MSFNNSHSSGFFSLRLVTSAVFLALCAFAQLTSSVLTGNAETVRVETEFDARGQVLRRSQPYFDGESARFTEYRHDSMDRQTQVTHPDGKTVTTRYLPGDVFSAVEVTDETGNIFLTHFDEFGNEIHRDRFDDGTRIRTTFQYDVLNRLERIFDPLDAHWAYEFDGHGNKVALIDPGLGCRQMAYDAGNRLTVQIADDGAQITYTYDELDRIVSKTVDKGALQFATCASVPQRPSVVDDGGYVFYIGTPGIVPVADLLANDGDPNGDAISIHSVQGGVNGHARLSEDGTTIAFTPYFSPDNQLSADQSYKYWPASFTYTITDGEFVTTASVAVEVRWDYVNLTSLAIPDLGLMRAAADNIEFTQAELMANDIDANGSNTLVSIQEAVNGTVSVSADTGNIVFIPVLAPLEERSRPEGQDYVSWLASFTYTITDGVTETTATVEFEVQADPAQWLGYRRDFIESVSYYYSPGKSLYSITIDDLLQMHFPDTWENLSIVSVQSANPDLEIYLRISDGVIWINAPSADVSLFETGRLLTSPAYSSEYRWPTFYSTGGITIPLIYETSDGQTGTVLIIERAYDLWRGNERY
ncbi:Ig-like domain-containing protein [Roseibium sp. MMSF_3412]|uniref:Ig-like domain-containing protein n=1 Tax=Roseibium sp. MMSF_3412 TaxID=3046712 RepID=UPI00273FB5B3|nr:Ig-like domain-containing protein [Roseibium sp. MMSF_3412]